MVQQTSKTYKLVLLGKPDIICNGVSVRIPRSKSRGIVFYLAAQDRDVSRDKLQDMFWPDFTQQSAQHNLNVHLSDIRKKMPGLLESDNEYVRLSANILADCKQFDAYFQADRFNFEQHKNMLMLYQGDFLEGFNISGASDFDLWKSTMREHYLNLYIKGLIRLSEYHHENGEYEEELRVLQNAIQMDPLQERVYRSVMQIHYENGDFLQANAIYQKLQNILNDEIGAEPTAETQQFYHTMLEHRSSTENMIHNQRRHFTLQTGAAPHKSTKTAFVGMKNVLEELEKNTSEKNISILEGIEGSGKTRVLQEFSVTWKGGVLWINCLMASENLPYQPFLSALTDYFSSGEGQNIKTVLPQEMGTKRWQIIQSVLENAVIPQDLQQEMGKVQLFDAFSNLFLSLGRIMPFLVIVEDLEKADFSTMELMEHLAIRCGSSVSFAGSVSPVHQGSRRPIVSARLRNLGVLRRIRMPGFSQSDVAELLARKYGSAQEELAEWLWHLAGRNPFQLNEMIKSLPEDNGSQKLTTTITATIPASVREYFEPISIMLSKTARTVLDIAAVYGAIFPYPLIIQTAVVTEEECLDGLDELISKGILIPAEENEYEFFTVLVRETVYAVLNPSKKQWLHLKIAEAIEKDEYLIDKEEKIGLLAHHFVKSSQPKRAVTYALRAGDSAYKRSAWRDAIDYYEMAKQYAEDGEFLLHHLTAVYMSAGEEAEYRRLLEERSVQSQRYGNQEEYLVNELEARFSKQDRVEEYRWGIIPAYLLPWKEGDLQLIEEAKRQLELPTGDPYLRARLCMIVALRCCAAGDYQEASRYFVKIVSDFPNFTAGEQSLVIMAHLEAGVFLRELEQTERAISILQKGLSLAMEKEVIYAEAIIRCEYGKQLYQAGSVQEAKKQLKIALELSRDYRMVYIEARAQFEIGKIEMKEGNPGGQKILQEALHLTEITDNSRHLQIYIVNELYPYFSDTEKALWKNRLMQMDQQSGQI